MHVEVSWPNFLVLDLPWCKVPVPHHKQVKVWRQPGIAAATPRCQASQTKPRELPTAVTTIPCVGIGSKAGNRRGAQPNNDPTRMSGSMRRAGGLSPAPDPLLSRPCRVAVTPGMAPSISGSRKGGSGWKLLSITRPFRNPYFQTGNEPSSLSLARLENGGAESGRPRQRTTPPRPAAPPATSRRSLVYARPPR